MTQTKLQNIIQINHTDTYSMSTVHMISHITGVSAE